MKQLDVRRSVGLSVGMSRIRSNRRDSENRRRASKVQSYGAKIQREERRTRRRLLCGVSGLHNRTTEHYGVSDTSVSPARAPTARDGTEST